MGNTLFSIIIPVYGIKEQYLRKCLNTAVQQTLSRIEIIIVNDASPDNCGMICEEYAAVDSRIKVIHQENQGVSVARNNGLKVATADWIVFVDGDDWLELDACERLKLYIDGNQCDIFMFRGLREYADRQVTMNHGLQLGQTYDTECLDDRELLYRRAMQATSITAASMKARVWPIYYSCDKAYRREFLIQNNIGFPQGMRKSEDKVFILRCFERLSKLYYADETLYHYRIYADSICRRYSENADEDRIKLAEILKTIAARMDKEMGKLKGDDKYSVITKDYDRFMFAIITNVLFLKYYHPDYPHNKCTRQREARAFLKIDPFNSAVRGIPYSELAFSGKLKKMLLTYGFVTLYCLAHRLYRWGMNKIWRNKQANTEAASDIFL